MNLNVLDTEPPISTHGSVTMHAQRPGITLDLTSRTANKRQMIQPAAVAHLWRSVAILWQTDAHRLPQIGPRKIRNSPEALKNKDLSRFGAIRILPKYTPEDSKESEKHGENGNSERRCVPQCAENVTWQQIRTLIEACPDLSAEARQRLIEQGDEACRKVVTG